MRPCTPDVPHHRGFFKFTAIGTGFFAQHDRFVGATIAPLLYALTLRAFERVLREGRVPTDRRGRPWIEVCTHTIRARHLGRSEAALL